MNYYNEWDKHAAQWLRNLIDEGLIPNGDVDERSIVDVDPSDLKGYTQCHFFAGIGGWSYALELAGWDSTRPVWTGSCPCQPFSAAGKGLGVSDERHLWPYWFRLIKECKPGVVFGEQVAAAVGHQWLDDVSTDLEGEGYAIGATVLGAHSIGAPHRRNRLWFVADTKWGKERTEQRSRQTRRVGRQQQPFPWDGGWKNALARFRALDDGVPRNVAGCDAARNAIVPQVAAEFISAFDTINTNHTN